MSCLIASTVLNAYICTYNPLTTSCSNSFNTIHTFSFFPTLHRLDGFPEAKIYHSGLKFPTTRNGKDILSSPDYQKRIELCKDFEVAPALSKYRDTVQFFGFNQFTTYPDMDHMPATETAGKENRKQNILAYMMKIPACTAPMLAVWFYHVPSKQLLIEHNFYTYMTQEQIGKASFMLRMMMEKEKLASCATDPMPNGPKTMEGCKIHCEQMSKILELDVLAINDYHSYPGVQIREYDSREAFVDDFTKVLKKTGEQDPTGEAMYQIMNPKSFCACAIL